jgi:hypothetical protein
LIPAVTHRGYLSNTLKSLAEFIYTFHTLYLYHRRMKILSTFISLIFLCIPSYAQQQEFGWLLGTWKLKDKNVYEEWSKSKEPDELEGRSYRIKDKDTTISEVIRMRYNNDAFYYIPDVAGDQEPVFFKITKYDAHSFVAENPQHDFPKIIRYNYQRREGSSDLIEAVIEGDGKVIQYTFVREE